MKRPACIQWRSFLFLFAGLWLLAGCQSSRQPKPGQEGAYRITGNTPGQIAQVITEVFTAHDYIVRSSNNREKLVFEKPGGKFNNLAYGNWIGDEPVWRRVKVFISPVGEAVYDIRCEAYAVRDRGGTTEEEIDVTNFRTGSCKGLLREAADRLKH